MAQQKKVPKLKGDPFETYTVYRSKRQILRPA